MFFLCMCSMIPETTCLAQYLHASIVSAANLTAQGLFEQLSCGLGHALIPARGRSFFQTVDWRDGLHSEQMSSSTNALRGMHLPSSHRPVAHCSESVHDAPSAALALHFSMVLSQ